MPKKLNKKERRRLMIMQRVSEMSKRISTASLISVVDTRRPPPRTSTIYPSPQDNGRSLLPNPAVPPNVFNTNVPQNFYPSTIPSHVAPNTLSMPNMFNPHQQILTGNYPGPYPQVPPQNHYLPLVPVGLGHTETGLHPTTKTVDVARLSSETDPAQKNEPDYSNAMKPGNYLVFAFDAYVWTDPETREQHLLQIGLNSLSEPGYHRWIIPTNFKNAEGCPMKVIRDGSYVCDLSPNRRVEVEDAVDLKEALSGMLSYLRHPKNSQSNGVVLLSFDPEAITGLLMSIVKFDDLKLIFLDVVKGLGYLRAYLELGSNENMAGEYTPQAIKSLHSAGMVVLGDLSDMNGLDCANNAMLITAILRRCFSNADPPMNFIRRFFHPPKSILYRKVILNQNLNMSIAKFVPLQKFVEESLVYYEKHLIPSGILYELGTGSTDNIPYRLSSGLVRALVASFLEFDFLTETFLTKGHEGLETELEQALMPNVVEKNMSKDSKEYYQLTKVVSLVVSFFHIHGHKSFSQMLEPRSLVPMKKLKVSSDSMTSFDPMISEYLTSFGNYGKETQTLKDEAIVLATNLASVGLTLEKMVELWEKETNFRKNLLGMIDDLMSGSNDSMKLSSFLISFLTKHIQKLSAENFDSVGEDFKLSKSKILMMDALIPKPHISPSAHDRYQEDLRSLEQLKVLIEKELTPMIKVVVGPSETSYQLAEHFVKMLAYTGNSLSVLRARHSRGRLADAAFECCNLHEDVVPMGLSAVVMTEILEKYFST